MSVAPVLAVIPARGGSKGLAGKNVRPLAGRPLIAHSIACAQRVPDIGAIVVSTDSEEIARVAREWGAQVPFRRPDELATDAAPMWPVVQHALAASEAALGREFGSVLLLDPTSPARTPDDVAEAIGRLTADPRCDGVIGVSQPDFNPIWHCVIEADGYMQDLMPEARRYERRQDVPPVYRINATLYLWRRRFVQSASNWREGRLRLLEVPEERAVHIDTAEQFAQADRLLSSGAVVLPWLGR